MSRAADALPWRVKASLVPRVLIAFFVVHLAVRRNPLPRAVEALGRPRRRASYYVPPKRLGKVTVLVLWAGPRKPRCLFSALVLYRLVRAQGDPAELVIGLPQNARTKDAHAWVEVEGIDVGPPPGRSGHVELTRYGV
jgi:transglutaminase-like putative cysteine protease